MKIISILSGQEFLCIDEQSYTKILRKVHFKFGDKHKDPDPIFYKHDYVIFDPKFKEIKNIFVKSNDMFKDFMDSLKQELIEQIYSPDLKSDPSITIEKIIRGHGRKYVMLDNKHLLLSLERHPHQNHNQREMFLVQYRLYNKPAKTLTLVYVSELKNKEINFDGMKVEINGIRQDPPLRHSFHGLLKTHYGVDGKRVFLEKINCHDENSLPLLDQSIRSILEKLGFKKFLQDKIEEAKIPYVEKLVSEGKLKGDIQVASISSTLFGN